MKSIKYLVLSLMICIGIILSCNPYGFPIWPGGEEPKPDTITITIDTVPTDTLPLVVDTCQNYVSITTPKFCTWALNLDGVPMPTYGFYVQTQGHFKAIDLDSFIEHTYGGINHTYFSGINVAGIVDGIDNPSWGMQHGLFMADAFGSFYLLTFNPYNLVFNGALTPEQMLNELIAHPSFKRLGFWNSSCNCDQVNAILDYIIDNCIDGTGRIIDLRHAVCQDPDRIGLLHLAHFTVLQ